MEVKTKKRNFDRCLVVGLQKPPRRIKKKMNEKVKKRASSISPFVKNVNVRHLMPTRYNRDKTLTDLDPTQKPEKSRDWDDQDPETRKETLKKIKENLEVRWNGGASKKKAKWFYQTSFLNLCGVAVALDNFL